MIHPERWKESNPKHTWNYVSRNSVETAFTWSIHFNRDKNYSIYVKFDSKRSFFWSDIVLPDSSSEMKDFVWSPKIRSSPDKARLRGLVKLMIFYSKLIFLCLTFVFFSFLLFSSLSLHRPSRVLYKKIENNKSFLSSNLMMFKTNLSQAASGRAN